MNSALEKLLITLAFVPLTSLKAANSGLCGEVPQLSNVEATVHGDNHSGVRYPISKLLLLDLSNNNVSRVLDLPVRLHSTRVLLRENHQLQLAPGVLKKALQWQIVLDLTGTQLINPEEAAELLEDGSLKTTDMYAYRDVTAGHACKDLVSNLLKVTPSKFLPQKLCKCLPGWYGSGARCQECPANMFSDEMGTETCTKCPPNSTAPKASTKLEDCKCGFGHLHNGICACDRHHVLQGGDCTLCSKLHLQCESTISHASVALPDVGFSRLEAKAEVAHRCLPPAAERCPGSHQCGLGYEGTLCASCADGFWAKGSKCKHLGSRCQTRGVEQFRTQATHAYRCVHVCTMYIFKKYTGI